MKYLMILVLGSICWGQTLESVPRWSRDKLFVSTMLFSAAAHGIDGFTTADMIGPNSRTCPEEIWTPWMYGKHPSPGRVAGVVAVEFGMSTGASYLLRKARAPRWLWMAPMVGQSAIHMRGAIHNLRYC